MVKDDGVAPMTFVAIRIGGVRTSAEIQRARLTSKHGVLT